MPLIQSRSKKSMGKNIATEMEHGKPQKQAIAIAYSVKRKAGKKKMAEGGSISAANEKRPMPDDRHDDSTQIRENSSKKPANNDSWTDKPTQKQAMANDVRGKKLPIKRPRMVPSDSFSTRMYNEEGQLEDSASPGPYDAQPPRHDDEMEAKKSGHPVRDMQDEHSTGRKPYAKGGEVESQDYDHSPNKYEDDLTDIPPSEDEGDEMAMSHDEEGQDRQGPKVPDMEEPHNDEEDKVYGYADGGEIGRSPDDSERQPHREAEEEHHNSIAAAIMARRDRLHDEIDSGAHDLDSAAMMAEGGMLESEHMEEPNNEDQMSFQALKKENYNSSDLDVDMHMDAGQHGDEEESDSENKHDMISSIRRKMKAKRQF